MERLSVSERSELWDRWEAGESQRSISRQLGRSPSTVRTQLVSAGWRRPAPPLEWCSLRLSLSEREEISRVTTLIETPQTCSLKFPTS